MRGAVVIGINQASLNSTCCCEKYCIDQWIWLSDVYFTRSFYFMLVLTSTVMSRLCYITEDVISSQLTTLVVWCHQWCHQGLHQRFEIGPPPVIFYYTPSQETWLDKPLWLPTPRLLECCRDDCMPRGASSRQVEPLAVTPGGPASAQAEPGHVLCMLSVGMGGPGTMGACRARFLFFFFIFFFRQKHLLTFVSSYRWRQSS